MTTDLPQIAHRLAARTPAEIDSLTVSSAQSCGVNLRERTDWHSGYVKPDGTVVPSRVVKRGWVAEAEAQADLEAAIAKLDTALTPATREMIEMWLVELSVISARRVDAPETEELRVAAYTSRLAGYPADVARAALLAQPWRFFPTWAELQEVCEALVTPRREMRKAMEAAAWAARERETRARALPTKMSAVPTPEEASERRARVMARADDVIAGMKANLAAQQQRQREADAEVASRMWRSAPEPASLNGDQEGAAE